MSSSFILHPSSFASRSPNCRKDRYPVFTVIHCEDVEERAIFNNNIIRSAQGGSLRHFNARRFGLRTMLSLAAAVGLTLLAPIGARADVGGTSIAGHVYNDANGNGVLDAGETPLANVQVSLYDSANNLVTTTYTGPGGDHSYTFGGLVPGTYTVNLATLPSGYTATNAIPGMEFSGFVVVSTVAVGVKVSNTSIQVPAVTAGDSFTPNDFLITQQAPPPPQPVSICGSVYRDLNIDRALQSGEPGIGAVQIRLIDGNNSVVDTATTDANGGYCFMDIPAGTYRLEEVVPAGYNADNALTGTAATFVSITSLRVAATTPGTTYSSENFLLSVTPAPPPPINICGAVYRDLNCDGALQMGEPGLANVTLQLLNSSGGIVATAMTDMYGGYCFLNKPVGTYTVREVVPAGLTADNALPGTSGMFLSSTSLKVTATTGGTNYVNENFLLCLANGGAFTTFTQGGYGTNPHGNNPGALLQKNFASVYPNGLTVGIGNTLFFRNAPDVANFLPQGGTPGALANRYVNPTGRTEAGVFAGQVVTLQLSVNLSQAGVTRAGLANLQVVSGPLAGYTVAQVLMLANTVLGGNLNALPSGVSVSNLNDVVTAINENFDGGTTNKGYLR